MDKIHKDDGWEMIEVALPGGYRMVATVDRPNGDVYDLGQNNEGQFRLFRRRTDPYALNSHGKGEILSDVDLAGFGLFRDQSCEPERAAEEGSFSSLCRSHFIGAH